MKKKKRVKYTVQCANNPDHIFENVYTIIEGTENTQSEVQAYCPYCDAFVDVTIKGIVPSDSILRRFNSSFKK